MNLPCHGWRVVGRGSGLLLLYGAMAVVARALPLQVLGKGGRAALDPPAFENELLSGMLTDRPHAVGAAMHKGLEGNA